MKPKKPILLSALMHSFLLEASVRDDGEVRGDQGVVAALRRRGLAGDKMVVRGLLKVMIDAITPDGRAAIDNARIDPRSQPAGWTQERFDHYVNRWTRFKGDTLEES